MRAFRRLPAASLLLWAVVAAAGTVEVPRIDAPVGSGASASASVSAAPSALSAPTLAPSALAPMAAPAAAPVLAAPLSAPAALPAAAAPVAAPVRAAPANAAPAVAAAPGAAARAASFGKRVTPPGPPPAAAEATATGADAEKGADAAWSRSAALFDLSAAAPQSDAVAPDLPANQTGKTLARLRAAGASALPGGAIPGLERAQLGDRAGGYSGETARLTIAGKAWFLKRLENSPDPVIAALPRETRAQNEAGFAAVLRGDPQLSESFSVTRDVRVFRDGRGVYVLTEGLPAVGDGQSRRQELTPAQRADAAIIQLALGMGDMHGGDVLPLGGGRFGLIDFEKLADRPLTAPTRQQVDEEVLLKNFPLVDRLTRNDPALYRARFETWRAEYAAGGRARMDAALARSGWTAERRAQYLAAVDRNIETFYERLQPYLTYGNEAYERMLKIRAEMARPPPKKKGFFDGLFGP